jgi:hypothetical protein
LDEFFNQAHGTNLTAHFLHLLNSAELDVGHPAGIHFVHARPHVLNELPLDMVAQFGIEFGLETALAKQSLPPTHRASPRAASQTMRMALISQDNLIASLPQNHQPRKAHTSFLHCIVQCRCNSN